MALLNSACLYVYDFIGIKEVSNDVLASAPRATRAQARAQEAQENVIFKVQSKPSKDDTEAVANEREVKAKERY